MPQKKLADDAYTLDHAAARARARELADALREACLREADFRPGAVRQSEYGTTAQLGVDFAGRRVDRHGTTVGVSTGAPRQRYVPRGEGLGMERRSHFAPEEFYFEIQNPERINSRRPGLPYQRKARTVERAVALLREVLREQDRAAEGEAEKAARVQDLKARERTRAAALAALPAGATYAGEVTVGVTAVPGTLPVEAAKSGSYAALLRPDGTLELLRLFVTPALTVLVEEARLLTPARGQGIPGQGRPTLAEYLAGKSVSDG